MNRAGIYALAAVVAVLLVASGVQAGSIIYEGFDYPTGGLNGMGGTTESGLAGTWSTGQRGGDLTVTTPGLDWYGLPVSGEMITRGGVGGEAGYHTRATRQITSGLSDAGLLADGATLWFSFIADFTGQNITNTVYHFALGTDDLFWTDPYVYADWNTMANNGQGIGVTLPRDWYNDPDIGWEGRAYLRAAYWQDDGEVPANGRGELHQSGNGTLALNSTDEARALIVGKVDWTSSGETITLYAADDALDIGTPVVSLTTSTNLDNASFDTLSFLFKNGPEIDEIRFGATVGDVLPVAAAVPEPSTICLLLLGALCVLGRVMVRRRQGALK